MFKSCLAKGERRVINDANDPVSLLFDQTFQLGNAYHFPEYMAYYLGTESDEQVSRAQYISA